MKPKLNQNQNEKNEKNENKTSVCFNANALDLNWGAL